MKLFTQVNSKEDEDIHQEVCKKSRNQLLSHLTDEEAKALQKSLLQAINEEVKTPQKVFDYLTNEEVKKMKMLEEIRNKEAGVMHQKLFTNVDEEAEGREAAKEQMEGNSVAQEVHDEKPESLTKKLFSYINQDKNSDELNVDEKEFVQAMPGSSLVSGQKARTELPEKAGQNVVTEALDEWRNFDLLLLEKIEKIYDLPDGEEVKTFYRFKIVVGVKEFQKTVSADEVSNFKWVKTGSQGLAFIRRGVKSMAFDEFVSHVIEGSNPMVRTIYATNGWKKIKGKPVYVYANGTIGNVLPNVSGNPRDVFEFSAEKVGITEVFRHSLDMLNICKDKKITLPLYLFAHIGALSTLFDEAGFPVKFVISVIGETNSRKTSLALCMTKTINRREITKPPVNFNGTEGGIEKAIGSHPDAVLVIDDFMPAAVGSKQGVLDTKLEKALRIYGDREGVERMTDFSRNPSAGYYPVRGIGVVTGEHIRGVRSSLLRTLILQINRDSVDNDKLAYYQKNYQILNTEIADFIEFATQNYDAMIQYIKTRVELYRRKNLFILARYNEMYAQLMTGAEIILEYAVNKGYLCQSESQSLNTECEEVLRQVIQQNEVELNKKDYPMILREVCVSIAESGTNPLPVVEEKDYGSQVFEDEQIIYVRLDIFLQRLYTLMKLWGSDLPKMSKKAVLNILEQQGLIEVRSKSEGKRTLKLPGSKLNRQTFLYIKKSELGLA